MNRMGVPAAMQGGPISSRILTLKLIRLGCLFNTGPQVASYVDEREQLEASVNR